MKYYTVEMRGYYQNVEAATEEEAVLKVMLLRQDIVIRQHTSGCYQITTNHGYGHIARECARVSIATSIATQEHK
jgi:hypothetical protein